MLKIMARIFRKATSRGFSSLELGVMAIMNLRMPRWIGSRRKAMIMPRKMGRRIRASIVRNPRTTEAWNSRKKSRMAAAITQKAVTPAAK